MPTTVLLYCKYRSNHVQYETILQNLDQDVKVKRWHMGSLKCASSIQNMEPVP